LGVDSRCLKIDARGLFLDIAFAQSLLVALSVATEGYFYRGSDSSMQLPEGSSRRICLPPFPMTMSFRK
jgi:hypothetical protein